MLNRNSSGIYKIVNNITGKIYIGSAKYLIKRCLDHRRNLVNNVHKNKYLQRSWNFYGWQAFEFLLVELVEDTSKLLEREQYWIDTLNTINPNGYNASPIAGSKLGFRHTEETKARMKEIQSNRPKEIGAKISAGKIGHKHSKETKNKIRLANIHLISAELRAKQKASVSKPDKWPHGFVCKCRECLNKKNEYNRNYRKAIKEAQNVQI